MQNLAPAGFVTEGAALNAFAVAHGAITANLSELLIEEHLRGLGTAYPGDRPIPAHPTPVEWRFNARRWIVKLVGWSPLVRRQLPVEVELALMARWYSPPAERRGFIPS